MKLIVTVKPVKNPNTRMVATAEVEFVDAGIIVRGITLRRQKKHPDLIFVNIPARKRWHMLYFRDPNDLGRFRSAVLDAYLKARAIIDEQREAA